MLKIGVAGGGMWLSGFLASADPGPWSIESLAQPPRYEIKEGAGGVKEVYYAGLPYNGKPTRVFAWYATPGSVRGDGTGDENLPALVLLHGGGGTAWKNWVLFWTRRGYAALAMDLGGRGPDKARLVDGGPDDDGKNKIRHITKPVEDQWPYHAVANAILANSLLRSFPEIDPDRIAVAGTSWGGFLTAIAAGVDSRFAAAVPVYGCGFVPENSIWVDMGLFGELSKADQEKWAKLWDPSNYLPSVECPVFFVTGAKDFAYPVESWTKSAQAVKGPRFLRLVPEMPHSDDIGLTVPEVATFLDAVLKGAQPLPQIGPLKETGAEVVADVQAAVPPTAAALYYTTDRAPNKDRQWHTRPARVAAGKITAASPPPEATIFFVTTLGPAGQTVSSLPVIRFRPLKAENSKKSLRDIPEFDNSTKQTKYHQ